MKNKILIAVVFCLFTLSCSISNNDNTDPPANYKVEWHLTHVSGGVAGVDETFDMETIIWTFNEATNMLTVENTNEDNSKEDGLVSGSYSYSIAYVGNKSFLTISSNEFGEIVFTSENKISIDQNSTSEGSGADGFIYTFTRKLIQL